MSNHNPLENHRRILREREKLFQHREEKSLIREELEITITQLQQDLSEARQRLHKKNDPYSDGLVMREETLHVLKNQKIELDRWLDASEEITAEELQADRQELVRRIMFEDPAQKLIGENHEGQIQFHHATIGAIDELLTTGQDLARFLERGKAEGQSMRRGGWLRYIAGTNPNLVIIACLVGMETTAGQLAATLHNTGSQIEDSLRERLLDLLHRIKLRSQAKWRWSTLPKQLGGDLAELQEYLRTLEQSRHEAIERRKIAELRFEQWLFGSSGL